MLKSRKILILLGLWIASLLIIDTLDKGSNNVSGIGLVVFAIAAIFFVLINLFVIVFVIYAFIRAFVLSPKPKGKHKFFTAESTGYPNTPQTWAGIAIGIIICALVVLLIIKTT